MINSFFKRVKFFKRHVKYKIFRRFTLVNCGIDIDRYFVSGFLLLKVKSVTKFCILFSSLCGKKSWKFIWWDGRSCFSITKFIHSINYWFVILNHPKWVNSKVKLTFIMRVFLRFIENLNAAVMFLLKGLMTHCLFAYFDM